MGLCPFMSTPYNSSYTLNGFTTGESGGSGGAFVEKTRNIDITRGTADSPVSGILTVECRQSNCQLWDVDALNCGANLMAFKALFINKFDTILGKEEELDVDKDDNPTSLITYMKNMYGKQSERDKVDNEPVSSVIYLKTILGKYADTETSANHTKNKSLLYMAHHSHLLHDHIMGQEIHFSSDPLSKYMTYIMEFMCSADLNADGKCYGRADSESLKADLPSPIPPILRSLK